MPRFATPLFLALCVATLGCLPLVAGTFYVALVGKIMILAVLAMSLDLLVGFTGLTSLGHAAFFGIGAYSLYLLSSESQGASLWLSLPAAMLAAAFAALLIGLLVLRSSGVYFIMVTLAFSQMFFYYATGARWLGGSDGSYIDHKPDATIVGVQPFDLGRGSSFYYAVLISMLATYLFLLTVLRSPFGHAIRGIKANEHRMRALGFATFQYKLAAFVIAGALAGLAGYFDAAQFGVVNPDLFGWRLSGDVLMMVILGGMGTLHGPVFGAFALVLLENFLGEATTHWLLPMGLFIILAVLLLPGGLAAPFALAKVRWERRRA